MKIRLMTAKNDDMVNYSWEMHHADACEQPSETAIVWEDDMGVCQACGMTSSRRQRTVEEILRSCDYLAREIADTL